MFNQKCPCNSRKVQIQQFVIIEPFRFDGIGVSTERTTDNLSFIVDDDVMILYLIQLIFFDVIDYIDQTSWTDIKATFFPDFAC